MTDRRYTDEETAEIFRRATVVRAEGSAPLVHVDGMTLAQIEAVAREAGIEPERVAAAAREIDLPREVPQTAVRVPVSVARSVELPRKLNEAEWEFLVTRLRETFDAAGKLETHGSLKQWSNGNLRVMLEPGINGHRLRFVSVNAGMRVRLLAGTTAAATGVVVTLIASVVDGQAGLNAFASVGIFGIVGAFVAAAAATAVKKWRLERRAQFDALAGELERLTQR